MTDRLFDVSTIPWELLGDLEKRIGGSEATGIRARWEFGCWLRDNIPLEVGGRGRESPLLAVAERLQVSRTELQYRRQFAAQYPAEEKLSSALDSFGSWHEIIAHGLVREAKEPVDPPPLPVGEWRTIVVDPPWDVKAGSGFAGLGDQGSFTDASTRPLEYPTLDCDQIAAIDVGSRAGPDSHLFLWTINRYVPEAYQIARAWGFKPSTLLVWAKKPVSWGLGGDFGLTTEFCLYARRGKPEAKRHVDSSWFSWPRGRHSEKPEGFFDLIESVCHGPYLELFARSPRQGWDVWGNEIAA